LGGPPATSRVSAASRVSSPSSSARRSRTRPSVPSCRTFHTWT